MKKFKFFNRKAVVVSVLLMMLVMVTAVAYAANVTVDDFSFIDQTASTIWTTGTPLPMPVVCDYNTPSAPNTIGGHRDVCIQIINASTNGDQARLRTTTSQLALSSDSSLTVKSYVQWDGTDATPIINPVGLGGIDLTGGGTNDGVLVRVINSDGVGVKITLRIYTDGSNWAESSVNLATPVISNQDVVDLFFPFASFTDQNGSMDETSVGAIEAEIISLSPGPDLNIDLIEATGIWDYGDLPSPYLTTLSDDGARHRTTTGLRLGKSVDAEGNGVPDATAVGDDDASVILNLDDEDGVIRQPSLIGGGTNGGWTNGNVSPTFNGGAFDITISGGSGYPQVFIDFNGAGLSQVTLRNMFGVPLALPLTPGTTRVYFDIPAGTFDGTNTKVIPVRVRLSSTGGLTASGPANDGEVEDYIYGFGPTAVNLNTFSADSTSTLPIAGAVVAVLALISIGVYIVRREQKQA